MKSTIILLRNPLDTTEREAYEVDAGTRIIDWLQETAPDGYEYPIRLFVNQKEIDFDEAEYELKEGDVCAILVMPAEPFSALVVSYLIQAAISLAIGLALNLLFAPKAPKSRQYEENPVYSIGASRNAERLGEPIPVCYGEVLHVPDYASAPYTFYSQSGTHDMYSDQLMCLGVGEFEEIALNDIVIGETPASNMPPGSIEFKQFHKGAAVGNILSHQARFGQIQQQLWRNNWADSKTDEFLFIEHCLTVPEVTDWEFNDDVNTAVKPHTVDLEFKPGAIDQIQVNIDHNRDEIAVRSGQKISITGAGANDGDYYVMYAFPIGDLGGADAGTATDVLLTVRKDAAPAMTAANVANATLTADVKTSNAVAGPYISCPVGFGVNRIWFDVESPQGVYRARSSGRYVYPSEQNSPILYVKAVEIDNNNVIVPGGVVAEFTFKYTHNRPDPVRRTFGISGNHVTSAGHTAADFAGKRYQVTMEARHTFTDSNKIQNKVVWSGMRSEIKHGSGEFYGDVTLLAVRMKATNGISGNAQNQLKVRAKRKYKLLDGKVGISANPADVAHDIYTDHVHGLGRPDSEVDKTIFDGCKFLWDKTGIDRPEFNGVFLNRSTAWTGLESVLSLAVARPAIDQGQLTIVRDSVKPVAGFMFNDQNILEGSFEASYAIDAEGDNDAIEIEYRDPRTFNPAFVVEPSINSAGVIPESPLKMEYFGCTDKAYAEKLAKLAWNRRIYQRRSVRFDTEMEGMVPIVGDRILVSSPVVRWGISGRVIRIDNPGSNNPIFVLDKTLDWSQAGNLGIIITGEDGTPSTGVKVTRGATANEVILEKPLDVDIDMTYTREPPAYSTYSFSGAVRNMTVTKISHTGGRTFTVEAADYPMGLLGNHQLFAGSPEHLKYDLAGKKLT